MKPASTTVPYRRKSACVMIKKWLRFNPEGIFK